jgi:hypothetical protein
MVQRSDQRFPQEHGVQTGRYLWEIQQYFHQPLKYFSLRLVLRRTCIGVLQSIAQTPQARDMVLDVAALVFQAAEQQVYLSVIANNRAWGNAPSLAQAIATRVLDEVQRRG